MISVCVCVAVSHTSVTNNYHCFQELKLKFYNLTITLGHHDNDYLAICRDYMSIYQTPQVLSDEVKWKEVNMIYVYLSSVLQL